MKFPTPSTAHISSSDFGKLGIYEPSEDSYLLLDTLSSESEREWLGERFGSGTRSTSTSTSLDGSTSSSISTATPTLNGKGKAKANGQRRFRATPTTLVLEVGTGSGILIAFLTAHAETILGRKDVLTMAVDVNWNAVREGRRTVESAVESAVDDQALSRACTNSEEWAAINGKGQAMASTNAAPTGRRNADDTAVEGASTATFLDTLLSSLTTSLRPGSVDVLIFNPPYVPTSSLPSPNIPTSSSKFDIESQLLALAYAGGEDGMEITNRLLDQLDDVLSARGVAYVLLCARNKPANVIERLRAGRWGVMIAGESGGKGGWERLSVLRIYRQDKSTRSEDT